MLVDHEMRRAGIERRNAMVLGGAAAIGALGIVAIVFALVFGSASARADVASGAPTTGVDAAQAPARADTTDAVAATAEDAASAQDSEADVQAQDAATESAPEPAPAKPAPKSPAAKPATQRVSIVIGDAGYEPTVVEAKAGARIELTVGKGEGCAAGFLIPELGVELDNSAGPATAQLGVLKAGEYRFSCAMDMVEGRLVVR